jgi:heme-degrading monooxygenase HmoA
MFSVLFEVHPNRENWDHYLDNARMLRPELEQMSGFVDNIRYKSLTREGWIFSLSSWRDEKSLVRWRTQMRHHEVQQQGRDVILADYHLRVGQITADNQLPVGFALTEQGVDENDRISQEKPFSPMAEGQTTVRDDVSRALPDESLLTPRLGRSADLYAPDFCTA